MRLMEIGSDADNKSPRDSGLNRGESGETCNGEIENQTGASWKRVMALSEQREQ